MSRHLDDTADAPPDRTRSERRRQKPSSSSTTTTASTLQCKQNKALPLRKWLVCRANEALDPWLDEACDEAEDVADGMLDDARDVADVIGKVIGRVFGVGHWQHLLVPQPTNTTLKREGVSSVDCTSCGAVPELSSDIFSDAAVSSNVFKDMAVSSRDMFKSMVISSDMFKSMAIDLTGCGAASAMDPCGACACAPDWEDAQCRSHGDRAKRFTAPAKPLPIPGRSRSYSTCTRISVVRAVQ